jgi:hypothetical protein
MHWVMVQVEILPILQLSRFLLLLFDNCQFYNENAFPSCNECFSHNYKHQVYILERKMRMIGQEMSVSHTTLKIELPHFYSRIAGI